jgi:hypothetical protein
MSALNDGEEFRRFLRIYRPAYGVLMGSYLIVEILPNSDQLPVPIKADEDQVRKCSSCTSRGQRF